MAEDCAAIKTKLDDANDAYQRIVTGRAVRVVMDSDGSRVEYSSANRSQLAAYIAMLQAQYNACIGGCARSAITHPLDFIF